MTDADIDPELSSDYETQQVGVSFLRNIMENLDGMVGVGYVDRDSEDPDLVYDRITYFINVTYRNQF